MTWWLTHTIAFLLGWICGVAALGAVVYVRSRHQGNR